MEKPVGSSEQHITRFISLITVCLFIALLGFGGLAFLVLIAGLIYFDYIRALLRGEIRQKLGVFGTFHDDLMTHCCPSCCAIAQEAREASKTHMPVLDYCSGQPLSALSDPWTPLEEERQYTTWQSLYSSLSITSQLLLKCWAVFLVLLVIVLALSNGYSVIVLFLLLLQPLVLLYLVYWRWYRSYGSLDVVVKLFTVGFWMATTQAMCLEYVLESLITVALGLIVALTGGLPDSSNNSGGNVLTAASRWMVTLLAQASSDGDDNGTNTDGTEESGGLSHSLLRRYFPLVVVYCILMSFGVAAGVEECTKHFALRFCRLNASGTAGVPDGVHPQSLLVYCITIALGFATAENLEYVFSVQTPGSGRRVFLNELTVLALRICLPVHVLCGILQAAQWAKAVHGLSSSHVVQVLLPAILLHGSFDGVLFLLGAIETAYYSKESSVSTAGIILVICQVLFPVGIAIFGLVYSIRLYREVESRCGIDWRPVRSNDEETGALETTDLGRQRAGSVGIVSPGGGVIEVTLSPLVVSAPPAARGDAF
eukprot:gene8031-8859_t